MRGLALAALGAAALAANLPAIAQQPPEQFHIDLSPQDMAVVQQGLLELPGKTMLQTYSHILEQLRAQSEAAKKSEPEKKPELAPDGKK